MGKERQAKFVRIIKEDIESYRSIRNKLISLTNEVDPKILTRILHLFEDISNNFDTLASDIYSGKETY